MSPRDILQGMTGQGQYAHLPDGRVRYELAGPEGGSPLLLIHGLAGHMHIWDRNFHALADRGFRVLRTDLFGRGLSDRVAGPYDAGLFVRQVHGLLGHVGFDRKVAVCGLSMGGAVALRFAEAFPERVSAMMLVASYAMRKPGDPMLRLTRPWPLGEAVMATVGAAAIRGNAHRALHRPELHGGFNDWFTAPMRIRGSKRALLSTIRHMLTEDHMPSVHHAAALPVPKLIVWGQHDRILPLAYGQQLGGWIPDARFELFGQSGHLPQLEEAERFNGLAVEFLSAY